MDAAVVITVLMVLVFRGIVLAAYADGLSAPEELVTILAVPLGSERLPFWADKPGFELGQLAKVEHISGGLFTCHKFQVPRSQIDNFLTRFKACQPRNHYLIVVAEKFEHHKGAPIKQPTWQ